MAPKGHHLNKDAPAQAKLGETVLRHTLSPSLLSIKLPPEATGKNVDVSVFICDDANTFCLKKKQTIAVPTTGGGAARTPLPPKAENRTASRKGPEVAHRDRATGFHVNDPETAFREAERKKLPLLIDFFGVWCPPCNYLDAMVFSAPEFKNTVGKKFVRLKLDADAEKFAALKAKYRIQGLPTLVFATQSGDEIFRLIGFHPREEVMAKAEEAFALRAEGYEALTKRAQHGDAETKLKAARIALDRDEPEKALELLKTVSDQLGKAGDPRRAELYRAQLKVARLSSDVGTEKTILEKWVGEFPNSVDTLENLPDLAGALAKNGDQAGSQKALRQALALSESLLSNPGASQGSYYTPADLAQTRAGLLEELGEKERAQAAYLASAEAYAAEGRAEGSAFPRGPNLERAYCLGKAGKIAESAAIFQEGIRRFPEEYTFHAGLAKLWLDSANDPKKAATEAELALARAYGGQRLKATMTLAKALEAQGKVTEAVRAIDAELEASATSAASGGAYASQQALRKRLTAKRDELKVKAAAKI